MRGFKLFAIMAVFIGFVGAAFGQNDTIYKFTLVEAQDFAIDNFFVSKNAKLDIEIAKKKIWEATAMGLPNISGGVDYTYLPDIPEISFGATTQMGANKADDEAVIGGDFRNPDFYKVTPIDPTKMGVEHNVSYNVRLTQLIFSGEYIVGLQASKVYSVYSQENYDKVKLDIRESVAETYYSVQILKDNERVLTETLTNLNLTLEHTTKFFEQGLVEDIDVDQLSLVVKRTQNSLRTITSQKEYLMKLFKYQIGLKADDKIEFKQDVDALISANVIEEGNYEFNLDKNINYKLLTTQEDLKLLSLKREKSAFLPTISGFYQYKNQFKEPAFNTNIKHMIGVSLAIPIFSSGMRISKVGQANIALDKAQNMKEQEAQRLIIVAEQSRSNYNIALDNYHNEKENFELSKRVFNKSTIRFKEGVVSSLDLSLINNQYLEAQLSLASATQKLLIAKVALDKAFNRL